MENLGQSTPQLHDLTNEEKLKAKENGFIMIGKTGTGKTSLLNLLYGCDIGKVGYSSKSETSKSEIYYIKEKENSNTFYYCIIDTPGLYDTKGDKIDEKNKDLTKDLISNENIKIKGILFLSNFQNERFDYSEIDTLIQYNAFFPLKDFWKHIILVFTHYYGDPNGDTEIEMKKNLFFYLSDTFEEIMSKVKNVSTPVKFKDINKLFINIYSKKKNKRQIESNESYKKCLIKEIIKYTKYEPMYNKLYIFHFKNFELEEGDQFLYDCDYILYVNSKNKIINQSVKIKNINNKSILNKDNKIIELSIISGERDELGNLYHNNIKNKDIFEKLKENAIGITGIGFAVSSIVFFILSNSLFGIGLIPGGALMILNYFKYREKKSEESKENEKFIEQRNLMDYIKKEIKEQINIEKSKFK
jgi:hypothetical protein